MYGSGRDHRGDAHGVGVVWCVGVAVGPPRADCDQPIPKAQGKLSLGFFSSPRTLTPPPPPSPASFSGAGSLSCSVWSLMIVASSRARGCSGRLRISPGARVTGTPAPRHPSAGTGAADAYPSAIRIRHRFFPLIRRDQITRCSASPGRRRTPLLCSMGMAARPVDT